MSLLRDPDAAARYEADPAQAIADAGLDNVTSADVENLVPLVSDSMSMSGPTPQADNIWASGAATSAFDAFDAVGPLDESTADPTVSHPSLIDTGVAEPISDGFDEAFSSGFGTVDLNNGALMIDSAADAPGAPLAGLDGLAEADVEAVVDADPTDDSFDIFS